MYRVDSESLEKLKSNVHFLDSKIEEIKSDIEQTQREEKLIQPAEKSVLALNIKIREKVEQEIACYLNS